MIKKQKKGDSQKHFKGNGFLGIAVPKPALAATGLSSSILKARKVHVFHQEVANTCGLLKQVL